MAASAEKLRWYFTNLPAVTITLIITIIIWFEIRFDSEGASCVRPHMILTGQISRLIRYAFHHKNIIHLLLSIGSLALFGTTAERQAGSFRFLWLVSIFSILSGSLTVLVSILLGFSSFYSSLMYSCPASGLTPAMFGIMVLVFKSYPLKKTVFFFLMIPNAAMPWIFLIMSYIVMQDNMFVGNLCGCIVGSLYLATSKHVSILPTWIVRTTDGFCLKIFNVIPLINYIPGASEELPVYSNAVLLPPDIPDANFQPEDYVVPIEESSVPQYKVDKLMQMGFNKEESIVALNAANHNIEQAISILSCGQVGSQTSVVPMHS